MDKPCRHEKVRLYILNGLEWDGNQCLVGHIDSNDKLTPGCWSCPECNKYVSYQERIGIEVVQKGRMIFNGRTNTER